MISVSLFGHSGDNEIWENMDEGTLTKTKEMLDEMHKRKINMSDEIFVINVGGYIGASTRSKIEYANATGKSVRYLEQERWNRDATCKENAPWDSLANDEKNRTLLLRQKKMLDLFRESLFRERGTISKKQHDKSLHDLIEKMNLSNNTFEFSGEE